MSNSRQPKFAGLPTKIALWPSWLGFRGAPGVSDYFGGVPKPSLQGGTGGENSALRPLAPWCPLVQLSSAGGHPPPYCSEAGPPLPHHSSSLGVGSGSSLPARARPPMLPSQEWKASESSVGGEPSRSLPRLAFPPFLFKPSLCNSSLTKSRRSPIHPQQPF